MLKIIFLTTFMLLSLGVFAQSENLPDDYVGHQMCAQCHQQEMAKWSGSHHHLAMQEANNDAVLGNFDNARFNYFGLVSKFYRKDGSYWVQTDGPDGRLRDYQIKYTFGVFPLQQYLIEFPGGKLQVLDIAWDSRNEPSGGQRWFHLHPDKQIKHDDADHWTGPNLNWNSMCAYCHTTNLQKNHVTQTQSYQTSWSEMNVSCESCHGPGARHVQWAKREVNDPGHSPDKGLTQVLDERSGVHWLINQKTGIPFRSKPLDSQRETETCARCHSRRSQLADDHYMNGKPAHQFLEQFKVSLLSQGLYHADGQILDEVYVYGSFLQSKMYQAGVICSDCHDPHIADLKLPGDRVCNQCHLSKVYRTAKHHFHRAGSTGASCISCHMPVTTYMGVDDRHDHSFRIPRPDLSVSLGIPNTCNKCHTEPSAEWSRQKILDWYGKQPLGLQQFAAALHLQHDQARSIQAPQEARNLLNALVNNPVQPVIARATVISAWVEQADHLTLPALQELLQDPDPMIRLAAVESLSLLGNREQLSLAFPLLNDPLRSIRAEVARLLVSIDEAQLSEKQQRKLQQARNDYIATQQFNAERPQAQLNLAHFYLQLGEYKKAENAYRQALKLQPKFVPAYLGFAAFYSTLNRENEAAEMLQQGIEQMSENPDLYHALGLSLVRQHKPDAAMQSLQMASNLAGDNLSYQYVYAIALHSTGQTTASLTLLDRLHQRYPANTDVLLALVTINRDAASLIQAVQYLEKLKLLMPDNIMLENISRELQTQLE